MVNWTRPYSSSSPKKSSLEPLGDFWVWDQSYFGILYGGFSFIFYLLLSLTKTRTQRTAKRKEWKWWHTSVFPSREGPDFTATMFIGPHFITCRRRHTQTKTHTHAWMHTQRKTIFLVYASTATSRHIQRRAFRFVFLPLQGDTFECSSLPHLQRLQSSKSWNSLP